MKGENIIDKSEPVAIEDTSWDSLGEKSEAEQDRETLNSEAAQNILPYLTLDELSEHEQAEVLRLGNENISSMKDGRLPKNKSATFYFTDNAIAMAAGEAQAWGNGEIPPKLSEARKLFCASLLNATNDPENPSAKWEIYDAFFGASPDFSSYCGGLKGSLELLTIADRVNQNPCSREIYDEIVYDYAFSQDNAFDRVLSSATPIEQMRLLPNIYNVSRFCSPGDYSERTLDKITTSLENFMASDKSTPMTKMIAEDIRENIRDDKMEDMLVELGGRGGSIGRSATRAKVRQEIQSEQPSLHAAFPDFDEDDTLVQIAPEVAATIGSRFQIGEIMDSNGRKASLLAYEEDNSLGIDRDTAFLLGAAHNPDLERLIDLRLGVILTDVPLDAQVQLLKFMTEAGDTRFDSLCSTLHKVEPGLRLKLAEGFLAADFGEDFGDALLDIANSERISGEQLGEILDQIGSCRESIKGITGLYAPIYNGDFTQEYARAANERLTDVITVFKKIAVEENGKAKATLRWGRDNKENRTFGYNEAIEALKYETTSLSIINGVLKDVLDRKEGCFAERLISPDASKGTAHLYSYYNLYSPNYGFVSLHTRAEGSSVFDRSIEYGGAGTEASISFMTNPVAPFEVPAIDKDDSRNKNRVSALRLDREGRNPDWEAGDPRMNPVLNTIEIQDESGEVKTIKVGAVSVDLAAIKDAPNTPSGKIARLVSVGNQIRSEEENSLTEEAKGGSLNHNMNGFNHAKYGTTEGFKGIVEYLDNLMMALCEESPPAKGQSAREREIAQQLHEIEQKVTSGEATKDDLERQRVLEAAGQKIKRERGRMAMRGFDRAA